MPNKQIPPWIIQALQELQAGVKQGDPRILDYLAATDYDGPKDPNTASCAAFVNFCLEASGVQGNRSAAAADMAGWGKELPDGGQRLGCIIVFEWDNGQHHTAFFLDEDDSGEGMVIALGSNQSRHVCVTRYPLASVTNFRWPEE